MHKIKLQEKSRENMKNKKQENMKDKKQEKEEDVIVLYKEAEDLYDNEKCKGKYIITWVMADMIPGNPRRGIQIPGTEGLLFSDKEEMKEYATQIVEKKTKIRNFEVVFKEEEKGKITLINGLNPYKM